MNNLINVVVGNGHYNYKRRFFGLKASLGFFTQILTFPLAPIIKRKELSLSVVDNFVDVEDKIQMFEQLQRFQEALQKFQCKSTPYQSSLFLIAVKILGCIF